MRASITVWNVPAPSLEERLDEAAALGFRSVALTHALTPTAADHDAERLGHWLEARHLEALVHSDIGNATRDQDAQAVRQHIEAVARFQQETGRIRLMTFDPGFYRQPNNTMAYHADYTLQILELALERLAPLGIRVGLENWAINAHPQDFTRVAEALGDPALGILLDLGHLHIALHSGALASSPDAYIAALPLPIWEIHVHDNDGERDRHQPLGWGTLDVEAMAGVLQAHGFDGYVTVEIIAMPWNQAEYAQDVRHTRDQMLQALWAASDNAPPPTGTLPNLGLQPLRSATCPKYMGVRQRGAP
jgi:sugar phosphate isomerase/epimerase